jgi:hypothetical protein
MAADPVRRRRRHSAASARILTAGLSSAAAFGMVAGMSAPATGAGTAGAGAAMPERETVPPESSVLVIRRHWLPATATPAGPLPAAAAATPARPRPSLVAAPRPAPQPVTRTRGS